MAELIRARARWFPMAVVALVAAAAAAVPSSAQSAPPSAVPSLTQSAPRGFFGLVPTDLQADDYQLIQRANVGTARLPIVWDTIESAEGQFDWAPTDRQIGGFASRGIDVLPVLFGTPSWLASDPEIPPVGSDRLQGAWERFVGQAVRRYGEGGIYWRDVYPAQFPGAQPNPITTWQIWNEQNGPKHFQPAPDVTKYATLLGIANRAVEAENPDGQILTGGLASQPTGSGGIDAWKYVKKLTKKKLSARNSFDHVALHPYARDDREIVSHVKKMRKALKKGRKKNAQLWITEVGWSSVPNGASPKLSTTPEGQAERLTKTYSRLLKKRGPWKIGGVYWYTWRDFGGGVCEWCPDAGLVTSNLQPKPAFNAYTQIAG
jgi:polysaccharide biosynthesis protein PslG